MHKKINYILLLTAVLVFFGIKHNQAQELVGDSPVVWYSPEQADSLFKEQPKPMLISVYTEWCSWCKHMMKTTFASQGIAGYINRHFIPVRFDAETNDTITFKGKTYINKGVGKKPKHEFADYLLAGRFSFPTVVYIDPKGKKYPVAGYQDVKNIEPYLIYFAESIYHNIPLDYFVSDYIFSYSDRFKEELEKIKKQNPEQFSFPDTSGVLKTYSLQEAEALSKKNKKPVFIMLSVEWSVSSKIFKKIVLKNPEVTKRMNQHFYTVLFDAASQEPQEFLGKTFHGGKQTGHPHELTRALLKQNFMFPAFTAISPDNQLITELHGYIHSSQFINILEYYGEGNYKSMTYQEFINTKN
jgi:thioredoxin-related protein